MFKLTKNISKVHYLHNVSIACFSIPVGQAISLSAKKLPFRNSVKTFDQEYNLTEEEMFRQSKAQANGMFDMGVRPNDDVFVWMDNSVESIITFYASALAGVHCHLIDPSVRSAKQIEELLKKISVRSIYFSPEYQGIDRTVILGEVLPELNSIPNGSNMIPVLNILRYPKLHHVITTDPERPLFNSILNYRSGLTYVAYPDFVDLVLPKLEEKFPLLTYHYADVEGKLQQSKTFTQSDCTDIATKIAADHKIGTNDNVCQAATTCTPFGVLTSLACFLNSTSIGIVSLEQSVNKLINLLTTVHFDGLVIDAPLLKKVLKCDPLLIKDIKVKYGIHNGTDEIKLNTAAIRPANIQTH